MKYLFILLVIIALPLLFQACAHSPNVFNYQNEVYSFRDPCESTITLIEKAIELDPKNSNALQYRNLAAAYLEKGNLDKAVQCYEKAIELDPTDSDRNSSIYCLMGRAYSLNGNVDKAIQLFEKAIEAKQRGGFGKTDLKSEKTKKEKAKNLDKTIEMYEKAINLNPKDSIAYNKLGLAYSDKGNLDKAIQCFEKAIELKPNDEDAWNNLGGAYHHKGNFEKAIQFYEKAIELKPQFSQAYVRLGIVYSNKRNLYKAIQLYEKAIELDPKYSLAYNLMGIAYSVKDNIDKAIQLYKIAIELDSKYADANKNLGVAYYTKGLLGTAYSDNKYLDTAIQCFEKAIGLYWNNPNKYVLSDTYVLLGRTQDLADERSVLTRNSFTSSSTYKSAQEINPQNPEPYFRFANEELFDYNRRSIYDNGKRYLEAAVILFKKAANLGHKGAQEWLTENGYVR